MISKGSHRCLVILKVHFPVPALTQGNRALEREKEFHHRPLQVHEHPTPTVTNPISYKVEAQACLNWNYEKQNPHKAVCVIFYFLKYFIFSYFTLFLFISLIPRFFHSHLRYLIWRPIEERFNWKLRKWTGI